MTAHDVSATPRELQEALADDLQNGQGEFGSQLLIGRPLALHIAGHLVECGWARDLEHDTPPGE